MKHSLVTAVIVIILAGTVIAEEPIDRTGFYDSYDFSPQVVRSIWIDLDKLPYMEGGFFTTYLSISKLVSYKKLGEWAGMPIFVKGPHKKDHLNVSSKTDFGHYNKKFIVWARNNLIPASDDDVFRASTQFLYERHLKMLVRGYYLEYRKMKAQPELVDVSLKAYAASMAAGTNYHPQFENYDVTIVTEDEPAPAPASRTSPNGERILTLKPLRKYSGSSPVVRNIFRFWLRRIMDDTDREIALGLEKLLRTYDREFLERIKITAAK